LKKVKHRTTSVGAKACELLFCLENSSTSESLEKQNMLPISEADNAFPDILAAG
jgi:hypothetical protein